MMALGLSDPVLANLVKQRLVADLQQRRSLLTVPVGFFQSFGNGFGFGLVFGGARQRLQSSGALLRAIARCGVELRAAAVALRMEFVYGEFFIAQYQVTLDEVDQLSQIPRPGIIETGLQQ